VLAVPMRFPKPSSPVVFVLFVIALVWLALVVVSPFLVPPHTLLDLSGVVGGHENEGQFKNLNPVAHAVYWLGDAECHQLANRSYFLNGNQMPFCARDLGLFIGLVAGFAAAAVIRWKIPPVFVLLGLIPIGVDGGLQLVTSYESSNPLRLATGFIAGLVLALLFAHFVFVIEEEKHVREGQTAEGSREGKVSP